MLEVIAVPALKDNYIWMLSAHDSKAVAVDPGDSEPVEAVLTDRGLTLEAVLVTHHHWDHTGGVAALREHYSVPVYGPANERTPVKALTYPLADGDRISVLGVDFQVIEIPGHTLGHIAYFGADMLFSGDTLFSAGCGRVFEGDPGQMWHSLSRLAALPAHTRVYCGHEYTEANLDFALTVEPDNNAAQDYLSRARALRERNQPTLPSTLACESQVNPFLRCREASVIGAAEKRAERRLSDDAEVFSQLRQWKNQFRPAARRR